jgi:DNA polymerase III delta prime subunit
VSPEEKIRKTIETGNVSHAYIFEGSRISGKETAAKSFIAAVKGIKDLDSDPDHYVVRAEAGQGRTVRSVKDADMEKLQADLKMKPQGDRNSAIIYDADTMTVKAQNRFLKTLEEPARGTIIVLLSENTENLLETIRSRCVIYRFNSSADMPEEDMRAAARAACLDETVAGFLKGYETFVGERGVTLSGGQKQRTAIARMLVNDTPIMIFDDSLSAVDTETDAKIRKAIEQHFGKASLILISHRITTLSAADKILVLDRGRIVEEGTHDTLKSANGIYQKIYEAQSGSLEVNL